MGSLAIYQKFWMMDLHRYFFRIIFCPGFGLDNITSIQSQVVLTNDLFFLSLKQYLPHVVPLVFSSCNLDDGSSAGIDDSDDDVSGFGGVSSDEDVVEPRVRNISIRTGIMDEKAAATQSIGLFALHTKSSYSPYPFDICNVDPKIHSITEFP